MSGDQSHRSQLSSSSFQAMASVGVIAALLNIVIITILICTEKAVDGIVSCLITSRLLSKGRAPVVCSSDLWLLSIPVSLVKFRAYPCTSKSFLLYLF